VVVRTSTEVIRTGSSPPARTRLDEIAFAIALAVAGLACLVRETDWLRAFPGDIGDARFNQVILEHLYQWAAGRVDSLWSPGFFHPFTGALAFSDNHFGTGVFYAIWRAAGVGREVAFDLWFCTGAVASFVAAGYTFRRLGMDVAGAAAGGFVFAFALPVLAQEVHAQLIYRFPIPLALLALVRYAEDRSVRHLLQLAILLCVQFLCSIYLGVFLAMLVGAMGGALALAGLRRESRIRRAVPGRGWLARPYGNALEWLFALALALCVALMLIEYLQVAKAYRFGRPWDETQSMLPRIGSYLLADGAPLSAWIGSWIDGIPMRHEHQLFVGVSVAGLCAAGVLVGVHDRGWRELALASVIALALLVIVTVDFDGVSIYRYLARLPGLNAIRAVSRVVLVQLLPIAVLVGIAVTGSRRLARRGLFLAVVAILMSSEAVSHVPSRTPVREAIERLDQWRKQVVDSSVDDVLVVLIPRGGEPYWAVEIDAMLLAQELGIPTMNGYSGNAPPGFVRAASCSDLMAWLAKIEMVQASTPGVTKDRRIPTSRLIVLPDGECDADRLAHPQEERRTP